MNLSLQNELDIKQQEKNEIEKEIDDVGKDRNWLNWVEKFGDTIKLNTADEIKQVEKDVKAKVSECEKFAEESPYPEVSQLYDVVYEQENYPFIQPANKEN